MPKHAIEFQLPEEQNELDLVMQAGKMLSVLHDMSEHFVKKYKHQNPPSDCAEQEFGELRAHFFELITSWGVDLHS